MVPSSLIYPTNPCHDTFIPCILPYSCAIKLAPISASEAFSARQKPRTSSGPSPRPVYEARTKPRSRPFQLSKACSVPAQPFIRTKKARRLASFDHAARLRFTLSTTGVLGKPFDELHHIRPELSGIFKRHWIECSAFTIFDHALIGKTTCLRA